MFRSSVNVYDEPVAKTTDENLTGENWELILNLCDKVVEEGEAGARNVIAAVLKRLAHRNPNVQLYSLALTEALSKNCGLEVNREIASRSFTQGLERLVTDRTTHDKVKRRTLALIQQWAGEFESDPTLGIMEECYENLKAKNYKFDQAVETAPPEVDDSVRRKEEEELQRVLELSMHDKGGRNQWYSGGYTASAGASSSRNASSSNLPGTSGVTAVAASSTSTAPPVVAPSLSKPAVAKTKPAAVAKQHQAPAPAQPESAAPSYSAVAPSYSAAPPPQTTTPVPAVVAPSTAVQTPASPKAAGEPTVTRVRALHTFEPTELGELAFEKGEIIKVVDRQFKDWWRGQLKGKTGIFPVNYVEPLPEPTPADIAKEAQMEVDVFSQAGSIDRLLSMLRGLDPLKDNLSDNDELQELYRQSMTLRPKIVKLIDKYTQKRMELSSMNDNFKTARQMFETMMEESMAKHSPGVMYDARQARQAYEYGQQQAQSAYGWNPSVLGQQPPLAGGVSGQPPYGPAGYPPQGPTPASYAGGPTPQDYVQPYGPAPPVDPHSAYAQQYQQYQQPQQSQQGPPAVYQPEGQQQQHPPQSYSNQEYPSSYQGYPQQQQQPQQGGMPPLVQQPIPGQQPQQQPQPIPGQQQPQHQGIPGQQPPQGTPGQQQPGQQPQGMPGQPQPGIQQSQPTPGQYQQQAAQGQPGAGYEGYPAGPAPGGPQRQATLPSTAAPVQQPALAHQASTEGIPQFHQEPAPETQPQVQPSQLATGLGHAQQQPEPQPVEQQQQPQAQAQAQEPQPQPQPQQQQKQQGPPYVWSPTGQYPDPGAQAWAQYYALGGTDLAGRVYFTPESLPPIPGAAPASTSPGGGANPALAVTSPTPI